MCNDFGDAQNNLLDGDSSILRREPKWDTRAVHRCSPRMCLNCEMSALDRQRNPALFTEAW